MHQIWIKSSRVPGSTWNVLCNPGSLEACNLRLTQERAIDAKPPVIYYHYRILPVGQAPEQPVLTSTPEVGPDEVTSKSQTVFM